MVKLDDTEVMNLCPISLRDSEGSTIILDREFVERYDQPSMCWGFVYHRAVDYKGKRVATIFAGTDVPVGHGVLKRVGFIELLKLFVVMAVFAGMPVAQGGAVYVGSNDIDPSSRLSASSKSSTVTTLG